MAGGDTIQVTNTYAATHAREERARLRRSKKLSLVLDLDHTLVHCVANPNAAAFVGEDCRTFLLPSEGECGARASTPSL